MSDNNSSSGIGFFGLLTIVFITLKLTHLIDWSWWWVLSPILITVGLILVIIALVILVQWREWRKERKQIETRLNTKSKWQQRYDEMIEKQNIVKP